MAGTAPFAFADVHTSPVLLGLALLVRGAGLGSLLLIGMFGAYDDLAADQIPHASTATRIMQQLGGSFGTAILAVVLQRGLTAHPTAPAIGFHHAFAWALVLAVPALVAAAAYPLRAPVQALETQPV